MNDTEKISRLSPARFNKDHISGKDENGVIISGDPITFYGVGLVVFIDLLGFSKEVLEKWSEDDNSPLNKLLRIKESPIVSSQDSQIKFGSYTVANNGKAIFHNLYHVKVETFSDSIVLCAALPENLSNEDFMLAFLTVANASLDIWIASILEGFTVRGGLELDDVFWNASEIVGPAFIKAYCLEKFAKTSRIIVGERFLTTLLYIWKNEKKIEHDINVEDSLLIPLMKSPDGYISLNPKYMLNRYGVNAQTIINKTKSLQSLCKSDDHKRKYIELISLLTNPEKTKRPNKQDLLNYRSLLSKKTI